MAGKTIVIGIGDALLTDEGVGVRAVDAIKPFYSAEESIEFIDAGALSFTLINYFDKCDNLIIVDATNLRTEPGSIKVFVNDEVKQFLDYYTPDSLNDVNLFDVFSIARLMDRYPKQLALIAVQPDALSWGAQLSPPVEEALPQISHYIHDLLGQWNGINAQNYSYQSS